MRQCLCSKDREYTYAVNVCLAQRYKGNLIGREGELVRMDRSVVGFQAPDDAQEG